MPSLQRSLRSVSHQSAAEQRWHARSVLYYYEQRCGRAVVSGAGLLAGCGFARIRFLAMADRPRGERSALEEQTTDCRVRREPSQSMRRRPLAWPPRGGGDGKARRAPASAVLCWAVLLARN